MSKPIKMKCRNRHWHNVQEVVIAFRESDLKSCVVQGAYVDEWANEDSCLRSFNQTLKRLGYDGLIIVTTHKNRIYLKKHIYLLAAETARGKIQ